MSNFAIIDTRMSEKCKESLEKLCLNLIQVPLNSNLDTPISAHPDIFIFSHNKHIIVEEALYNRLQEHLFGLKNTGFIIKIGKSFLQKTVYPQDCTYNFAVCGNNLIGNINCIEPKIIEYADKINMNKVHVKQGYAKCNICVIGDNAIITEDTGIACECEKHGIDVLLLKNKLVKLKGYDNGFIGGATGVLDNADSKIKKILFAGNIENHPERSDIKMFCNKHGAEPFSLSDEDLYDYGSIIVL